MPEPRAASENALSTRSIGGPSRARVKRQVRGACTALCCLHGMAALLLMGTHAEPEFLTEGRRGRAAGAWAVQGRRGGEQSRYMGACEGRGAAGHNTGAIRWGCARGTVARMDGVGRKLWVRLTNRRQHGAWDDGGTGKLVAAAAVSTPGSEAEQSGAC
ncbi:MAG: hypothetical protein J3K34DRAFT_426755 [Monoraphidium minutum]|nr:MAG: hypothetical protein J3K34DRAFT_426755 [Monoraphidium minutum]